MKIYNPHPRHADSSLKLFSFCSAVDSKMGQNAVKTSENQDVLPLVGDQSHTQMVVCQQFPGPACVVKREMRLFSTNLGNKLGVWTQDVCFQQ